MYIYIYIERERDVYVYTHTHTREYCTQPRGDLLFCTKLYRVTIAVLLLLLLLLLQLLLLLLLLLLHTTVEYNCLIIQYNSTSRAPSPLSKGKYCSCLYPAT